LASYGDPTAKESVLNVATPYTECLGATDAGAGIVQFGYKVDGLFSHVGFGTRVVFPGFDGILTPGHVLRGETGVFSYSDSLWIKRGDRTHQVAKYDVKRFAGSVGLDAECIKLPSYVYSLLQIKSRKIASPPSTFMSVIYAPLNPKHSTQFSGKRWYRQRARIDRPKTKFILTHTFDTIPGMSGLPLFNTSGQVVGMHSRGSTRNPEADGSLPGDHPKYTKYNVALRADIFTRFARAKALQDNTLPVDVEGDRLPRMSGDPEGRPVTRSRRKDASGKILYPLEGQGSVNDPQTVTGLEGKLPNDYPDYDDDALYLRSQEWEDKLQVRRDLDFFDFDYGGTSYRYLTEEERRIEDEMRMIEEEAINDLRGDDFALDPGFYVYEPELVGHSWADDDYWDSEVGYSSQPWDSHEAVQKVPTVALPVLPQATTEPEEDFLLGGSLQSPKKYSTLRVETPSTNTTSSGNNMETWSSPSQSMGRVLDSRSLESATSTSRPVNRRVAPHNQSPQSSTSSSQSSKEPTGGLVEEPLQKPKASAIRLRFTTTPNGKTWSLSTNLSMEDLKKAISSLGREMTRRKSSLKENSKASASPSQASSGSGKESVKRQMPTAKHTKAPADSNSTGIPASRKKGSSKKTSS
jgi:hypothetical protein